MADRLIRLCCNCFNVVLTWMMKLSLRLRSDFLLSKSLAAAVTAALKSSESAAAVFLSALSAFFSTAFLSCFAGVSSFLGNSAASFFAFTLFLASSLSAALSLPFTGSFFAETALPAFSSALVSPFLVLSALSCFLASLSFLRSLARSFFAASAVSFLLLATGLSSALSLAFLAAGFALSLAASFLAGSASFLSLTLFLTGAAFSLGVSLAAKEGEAKPMSRASKRGL